MSLRLRTHPRGHIKPCLPLPAERPPSGPDWLHEIKHDGFRIMARRDANGVRLYTRTDTISPAASRRSRESPPVCTSARKPHGYDEWDPYVPPSDPYGPGCERERSPGR
jgi:hypothetical protein